ncbi:nucleotide binding protein-like protein [Protomyces lactucae-debilis]|uniref:Nucleotide binding protein-like protein n=1 Tax=Protomyces lactucae-debilis TaxID=2754530 RepID=A0A1Y2FHT9_PROLT|nr:nucleotide binding protein-like protein [Protomyces lactucae-debilis]ORY83167.1 nucleotide binding protein-like protein [Protomyces lactucae-debilis]
MLLRRSFSCSCSKRYAQSAGLPRSGTAPRLNIGRGLPSKRSIPNVSKVIAISSAKGGVGKSTVSVNVALAMASQGLRVGLLDIDVFGPSVPKLLNLTGQPELTQDNKLIPLQNYGLKAMSMGFLVDEGAPIVWRGMMVMKALQQLLFDVEWGTLDVLVLDMPPGTGDAQLTVTQQVVLDGAAIVSTPQDIALIDAVRGIHMFEKTDVKILGLIQNMSYFCCPQCNHKTQVFGTDGLLREAEKRGIGLIGNVPLHASICADADRGKPTVVAEPEGSLAKAYLEIAQHIQTAIGLQQGS